MTGAFAVRVEIWGIRPYQQFLLAQVSLLVDIGSDWSCLHNNTRFWPTALLLTRASGRPFRRRQLCCQGSWRSPSTGPGQ